MGFKLVKTVDLSKFGWEGCSLEFNSISYRELAVWQDKLGDIGGENTKAAAEIVDLLQAKFVSGTAIGEDGKKTEVTKDSLLDLPFDIILECATIISGGTTDPNL